ncbi:MAG: DUF3999 family protein [Wenzhouxiangellaceae bacterium]|nr:MAG: DUF3999 family protein [Wenzhouxiangellaceae bacterium]
MLALALACLWPAAVAAAPQLAWKFGIEDRPAGSVLRLAMDEAVVASLHRDDGRDWQIVDARGSVVAAVRLPENALVETVSKSQTLTFEQSLIEADAGVSLPLVLELSHDQTRLSMQAPRRPLPDDRLKLVFQALIASPGANGAEPLDSSQLRFSLRANHDLQLECYLGNARDPAAGTARVHLHRQGDQRPRLYQARHSVVSLPEVWDLACYGRDTPSGLNLERVSFEQRQRIEHRQNSTVRPDQVWFEQDEGEIRFDLPGPLPIQAIQLASTAPGVLSQVRIQSRAQPEHAWRDRAQMTLSTLDMESAPAAGFSLGSIVRDRHWRLLASPGLSDLPEIKLDMIVEEIVFLAQGEGPWRLETGSRRPMRQTLSDDLLGELIERRGQPWSWPRLSAGPREVHGGSDMLVEPPQPIPWQRYLLWALLVLGALIVSGLAWKLLRA